MFKSLYRKWRPKTFDDVVGQGHITETLKNEVASGRPSHAYLFFGTRGTGKTSCSKILAKAVNCLAPRGGNPCCECDVCRGIDEESLLDISEIDAASNSGVDNIRDLRAEANFTPAVAKYRVYIIDETHMLSTGAFNALLKILEEPPPHVIFILATTELHKVPATILSRCQRFDFKRIAGDSIAARLNYIAKEEGAGLSGDAALLIARLSDGGMRDALSLLDLCLTGTSSVDVETVTLRAGLVGQGHLFEIAGAVRENDGAGALKILEGLWEKSVDYQRLCEQLIGFYRNLMVAKSVDAPDELISCLPGELDEYKRIAKETRIDSIFWSMTALQDALSRMGKTTQRRAELEMCLIRLCTPKKHTDGTNDIKPLIKRIEALEAAVKNGAVLSNAQGKTREPTPTREEIRKTPVSIFDEWDDVLELLKAKNAALYGTLVNSTAYVGGELFLVDAGGGMFSEMVRKDEYAKESLRDAVTKITGKKYRLGPYNADRYEPRKEKTMEKLDEILDKASEFGVETKIK